MHRIYYRFLLFITPSVETLVGSLATLARHLETVTLALEARVEDHVRAVGHNAQAQLDAVRAVEENYARKADALVSRIEADRAAIRKALAAREAVDSLVNRG